MPHWKFTTSPDADMPAIAHALRELGADFNPNRDLLVLGADPAGYALSSHGDAIITSVKELLAGEGEDISRLPGWPELSPDAQMEILATAAVSPNWIADASFSRRDEPAADNKVIRLLYQAAGLEPPDR